MRTKSQRYHRRTDTQVFDSGRRATHRNVPRAQAQCASRAGVYSARGRELDGIVSCVSTRASVRPCLAAPLLT